MTIVIDNTVCCMNAAIFNKNKRAKHLATASRTTAETNNNLNQRSPHHSVAAAVRTRSAYYCKQFNTTNSHKHEDYDYSNLKACNAEANLSREVMLAGQVIKLQQDHELLKLKMERLTENVNRGFVDMKDDMKDGFKMMKDGFKMMEDEFRRIDGRFDMLDCWTMLLIAAFILKGGFDSVNSTGIFGMKAKENSNSTSKP